MNCVNLIGRQTRNSSLKTTTAGKKYLDGAIAVATANKAHSVDFFNYTAFDSSAEIIGRFIKKGDLFGITGKLATSKYTDKNGVSKTSINIIVERVYLLGSKSDTQFTEQKEMMDQADNFFDNLE